MITVSLCMIVKNEEGVLARCLDSVYDLVDEIIIVDTGSTDETREIAARYTEKIYAFEWVDDFAAARNYAFSKAEKEYWLWLDADDVLLPQDREAFRRLKQETEPTFDVAMFLYHAAFDDGGKPTFSYRRERLIRRVGGAPWQGAVHEVIAPWGRVLYPDIAVAHRKEGAGEADRNLRIYEGLERRGYEFSPRELYYYARELYYHGRHEAAAARLEAVISSEKAWLENRIEGCQVLSWCRYALSDEAGALRALLESLTLDAPRAELCCDIGKHFFDRGRFREAIFWYETAAGRQRREDQAGFIYLDCYAFLPYLQLCMCHYRLGDTEKARQYNELAGEIKPENGAYLYNKAFFEGLQKE